MSIAETVEEIIAGEEIDRQTAADIANEIAAMVVLNQALNNALWTASDKLGKANTARDKAFMYLNRRANENRSEIDAIITILAENGSHVTTLENRLRAISRLTALVREMAWHTDRAYALASEKIEEPDDMDDIPF